MRLQKVCRHWMIPDKMCPYGDGCQFLHPNIQECGCQQNLIHLKEQGEETCYAVEEVLYSRNFRFQLCEEEPQVGWDWDLDDSEPEPRYFCTHFIKDPKSCDYGETCKFIHPK